MVKNNKHCKIKRSLDDFEVKIVRELIRNPRSSDNQISKKTGIPVMTVNRKRKGLEKEHFLRYYASIDKGEFGLDIFGAKELYIIKFKIGITRKKYMEAMEEDFQWRSFFTRHVSLAYLGEKNGHLALIIILDAVDDSHLVDDFNGNIVPFLNERLGNKCIEEISTTTLNNLIRVHHNYMPHTNLDGGKIKEDWPDDLIFVDNLEEEDKQKKLI